MNKKGRSPTEVTQVSTCAILQYEQKRPFSHGSDSSKYMCYLTIWTPDPSPTEVTQVSTCTILQYEHQAVLPRKWLKWVHCAILQYEQTRPFSHGSDSSKYMCYLTIWTKKAVLPRKWLKWVHVLSYNMNTRPFYHGSDTSKYMCYLTIWTPGRSPTEVTQVSTCVILQYEHQAVLPTEVTQVSTCAILQYEHQAVLPRKWLK